MGVVDGQQIRGDPASSGNEQVARPRIVGTERTAVEVAYAAGFFDGEGAVSILRVRPRRSGKGRDIYKVLVIVVNTNRPVLERFQGQFGGKLYKSNFKTKPTYWHPSFNGICGERTASVSSETCVLTCSSKEH